MLYIHALQIGNVISNMIDKNIEMKTLSAYYPGLFEKTEQENNFVNQEEEDKDKHKLTPEMELHKARMDDFIFRHNRAFAKKRGEISGWNDT